MADLNFYYLIINKSLYLSKILIIVSAFKIIKQFIYFQLPSKWINDYIIGNNESKS